MIKRLVLVGVGLLVLTAAGLGVLVAGLFQPASETGSERVFVVEEGEPLYRVVRRLDADGLLPDVAWFRPGLLVWYARVVGIDRDVKSGEYSVSAQMSPVDLLAKLCSGQVETYSVTIPEGFRIEEIAQRFEAAQLVDAHAFVAAALSAEMTRSLGVEADTLEGYLFPETYRFPKGVSEEAVLREMVEQFRRSFTPGDLADVERSSMSLHEIVTLASIVEKETGVPDERPVIAAVFLNRLERGMRLQTDPTVIYGIVRTRGSFDGNLTKRDLQTRTPYNTYRMGGLPPGPIASVGMDSIRAVLHPAEADYLYFVSRNDGTHVFSTTLRQHTNAVNRYQKRRGR